MDSLNRHLAGWEGTTCSRTVVGWVRSGYVIPFSQPPPLTGTPLVFPVPTDPVRREVIQKEVDSLFSKGAVELADSSTPGFYSRLFTVPKKGGTWRPVLDLSVLNSWIPKVPFKMETVSSIRLAIRPGDWATSIDLSDAYFHVLIHPSS